MQDVNQCGLKLYNYHLNGSLPIREVYYPTGEAVTVAIELYKLDKEVALSDAKNHMTSTFELISQNISDAVRWSDTQLTLIHQVAKS